MALENFKQMQLAIINLDTTTFARLLPIYTKMEALKQGMDIQQMQIQMVLETFNKMYFTGIKPESFIEKSFQKLLRKWISQV